MKMIFLLVIFVWASCGMIGAILHNAGYRAGSWLFVPFMLAVPFIPLIAKMCGLI